MDAARKLKRSRLEAAGESGCRMDRLLTGRQVAKRLRISASFAYALMRRGAIPTVLVGKRLRVCRRDLERYIRQRAAGKDSTGS
jgi:excisionase family DNA binding protein